MMGFTPVTVLCYVIEAKAPNQLIFELIHSKIIPNDPHITELKPLQKVRALKKERYFLPLVLKKQATMLRESTWLGPDTGWPLRVGSKPSPRASKKTRSSVL